MVREFTVESCECGTPRVAVLNGDHCKGLAHGAKKACSSKILIDSELAAIKNLVGFPHDKERIQRLEAESDQKLYDSLGVPSLEEIKKQLGVD
jgi:hypothetical protein